MALPLSLSNSQSNDAVTLTLTDNSEDTTWGAPGSPDVTDIVISTDVINAGTEYHLLLDVTVTDKSGTETEYDTINLWDHAKVLDSGFTGFAAVSNLTWTFNPP